MLEQQINTTSRLEGCHSKLEKLQIDLEHSREAILKLIDKSNTINRLTQQLEKGQHQCPNIISTSTTNVELKQDALQLERMVAASQQQVDFIQYAINNFTKR